MHHLHVGPPGLARSPPGIQQAVQLRRRDLAAAQAQGGAVPGGAITRLVRPRLGKRAERRPQPPKAGHRMIILKRDS